MSQEKYFARIHYSGRIDGAMLNTLDYFATDSNGVKQASNGEAGLALFTFQDLPNAEQFMDISKKLLGNQVEIGLVKPR